MNRFLSMPHLGQLLSALTLALVTTVVSPNRADALIMFTVGTPNLQSPSSIQVGSLFKVLHPIAAISVGAFIPAANQSGGVTTSDFTGLLYNYVNSSTIPLIEAVSIPTGTAVDSDNFAYTAFASPHTLSVGSEYVVTAWHGTPGGGPGLYTWSEKLGAPAGVNPNVLWFNTQFTLSSGSPTSSNMTTNDFGGNLSFLAPEPASLSLLVAGGLLLMRRRRV